MGDILSSACKSLQTDWRKRFNLDHHKRHMGINNLPLYHALVHNQAKDHAQSLLRRLRSGDPGVQTEYSLPVYLPLRVHFPLEFFPCKRIHPLWVYNPPVGFNAIFLPY